MLAFTTYSKNVHNTKEVMRSILYFNHKDFDKPVCIAHNAKIGSASADKIFVTPYGRLVIMDYKKSDFSHCNEDNIIEIEKHLTLFNLKDLDAYSEEFTWQTRGQAYRVVDLLASKGLLSFLNRDVAVFKSRIETNLRLSRFEYITVIEQ